MCTEVDSGFWDGGREIVALNAEEATRVEEEGRMSLVQSTVSSFEVCFSCDAIVPT